MSLISDQSDMSAMENVLKDAAEGWTKVNVNKFIKPAPAIVAHQSSVMSLMQWSSGEEMSISTPMDFLPVVTISDMPTTRYPEYIAILVSATSACLRIEHPEMALALESTNFQQMIAVAVSVRAGFWAAMNWTPRCTASMPVKALVYDKKRRNLWLSGTRGDKAHDLWLTMFAQTAPATATYAAELSQVAVVAPMCGVMGASMQTASGSLYAFDLMMAKVTATLTARMGNKSAAMLKIGSAEMTETLTMSALTGASAQAARVWASDPLVAVGAQRRVAATHSEVLEIARREARLTSGRATPASLPSYDDANQLEYADPLLQTSKAAETTASKTEVEPTVYDADEDDIDLARTPTKANRAVSVVSAENLQKMEMAAADAQFIQEVARHAQQSGPPVPSMLNGANEEESVVWETTAL